MLRDELDDKVRKKRLTAKLKPTQEEVNRKAQDDAQFLWKKMKKLFLNGAREIELGFVYNDKPSKPAKVYFHIRYPYQAFCHLLTFKKIKHPLETKGFLQEIAENEGLYIFPHYQRGMRGTCFTDLWAYWTQYIYKSPES